METAKYLERIQIELDKMPDYVKQYNLGTNHSLTKVLNDSLVSTMSPINWLTQSLSLSLS